VIEFEDLQATAPDGSIIGIIGAGPAALGSLTATSLRENDAMPDTPGNYVLDHALSRADAVTKAQSASRLLELRRAGAAIVLISHDEPLLESCADEIWWIRDGSLVARGDPSEVLAKYRRHVADVLRASGSNRLARLSPTMRNGDGRAVLESIELMGADGNPTSIFRSGEAAAIRVTVRFMDRVEDPVVGIMIRTRIGLNVYGTNTELEQLKLGPVESGAALRVTYRFDCNLCPGDYTVTAASHDPDGVWHDWMEDAVAFAVSDSRYTAGAANLRARVEWEPR
jgi:lipopolysaccharide transport system ATP-binding protein